MLILIAGAALAGCIGAPGQAGDLIIDGSKACPTVVDNCSEARDDPSTPWVIEGLRLNDDLRIQDLDRDLIIRDFEVRGDGVTIRNLCETCHIQMSSGAIHSRADDHLYAALAVWDSSGSIHLDSVAIQALNEGIMLLAGDLAPSLRLTDVTFTSPEPTDTDSVTAGVWWSNGRVEARNVRVSGFPNGFVGLNLTEAILTNVTLRDNVDTIAQVPGHGLYLQRPGRVRLESIRAIGNDRGIVAVGANDTVIRNATARNNTDAGLGFESIGRLDIDGLRAIGNARGLGLLWRGGDRHPVTVRNATVTDNRKVGMRVGNTPARVNNVAFARNGWNWSSGDQEETWYGGLVTWYNLTSTDVASVEMNVRVRDTRFVDNAPFGVSSERPTVDARYNWWGCPSGPNTPGCDRTSGPVLGAPWDGGAGAMDDPTEPASLQDVPERRPVEARGFWLRSLGDG